MPDRYTSAAFADRYDLPEKNMGGSFCRGSRSEFVAPTFVDAVAFIGEIADLAEAANHHPDLDLRYRRLHVRLSSHDAGGLTDRDGALAATISEGRPPAASPPSPARARAWRWPSTPLTSTPCSRSGVPRSPDQDDPPHEGQVVSIHDPAGVGPGFWFHVRICR